MAGNYMAEHNERVREYNIDEFDAIIDTLHAIRRIRKHYGSGMESVRLTTQMLKMLREMGSNSPFTAVNSSAWHVAEGLAKSYNIKLDEPA